MKNKYFLKYSKNILKLTLFLDYHYDDFDGDYPTDDHEQVDNEMIEPLIANLGEMFDYLDHANPLDNHDMMMGLEQDGMQHCNHFPDSTYRLWKNKF